MITGEVDTGKSVAVRPATASLDTSRHVIIYLPNHPAGSVRMLHHSVATLGQVTIFYFASLAPRAADALAAEHGRTLVVVIDEAHLLDHQQLPASRPRQQSRRSDHDAHQSLHRLRGAVRGAFGRPTPPCGTGSASVSWPRRTNGSPAALAGMTAEAPPDNLRHHLKIAVAGGHPLQHRRHHVIHNAARGYPRAVDNLAINALTQRSPGKAVVDEKAGRSPSPKTAATDNTITEPTAPARATTTASPRERSQLLTTGSRFPF